MRELAEQVGDAALALELGQQSRLMILEYGWRLGVSETEANELLHEGEAWARRHDDPRALAALYNAFCVPCLFSLGNPQRARELAEEGLRLAEQAGDSVLACVLEIRLFFATESLGLVPAMSVAMEAVLRHSPEDMERASPLVGYNFPATVAGFRGLPYVYAGQLGVGLDHFRRGIALARANDAVEVVGWLLGLESLLWCERREIARARGAARESLEIAERVESPLSQAMALQSFGHALALEGDTRAAVSALERALSLAERVHLCLEPEILSARAGTSGGRARAGPGGQARAPCHRGRRPARPGTRPPRRWLSRLYELRADLARREGDAAAAEGALREAQRLYQEMGAPLQVERLAKQLGS